jgi:hypothetical protein
MRIKYRYLDWDKTPNRHNKIIKILNKYSIKYNYKEDTNCVLPGFRYELEFELYDDMILLDEIQSGLTPYGLYEYIDTEYNKEDINTAEYYYINVGEYQYPQPDDDFGYLERTFDLKNYCPACGIGKVQNNPFRLKMEPKQKNSQFWGLYWEYDSVFVREETKNILEKEKIQGIHFIPVVIHKTNKPIDKFYQLKIETVLDYGFDSYNTKRITCKINNEENTNTDIKYCGRIKYHHPNKGGYLFDRAIFSSGIDFCLSNEYFGSGGMAHRIIVVSKRIYEIINKNMLKGIKFIPIMYKKYKGSPNCT